MSWLGTIWRIYFAATEDSMAYTDLLFDICQQFGIHYYTATKKNAKKKTMPTALWHICSEHAKKPLTKITVS